MERTILHVDMNKFYANVELLHHPELRGHPLAVGGDPEARHGIVLTADALAKARGVKTGMALWQAKQVCPEIIFVPPRMDLYLRFSRMARKIYAQYSDRIEPFGIDESWIDLTGTVYQAGNGLDAANEIRQRIKDELGLTASVGIGWNKVLAKFGSDYKKPDATTQITRETFKEIFWSAPAGDLLYVGPATQKKLHRYCIDTVGKLANTDPAFLHRLLGKMGLVLHGFANGYDDTPVALDRATVPISSIGNSITTPRDLTCNEDVKIVVFALTESVAARMRENGVVCRVVELTVRDNTLYHFSRQQTLAQHTNITSEIAMAAMNLFTDNYSWQNPIRSVGVRACKLIPAPEIVQYSFFVDQAKRDAWQRIDATVDDIRRRYGYYSVQRGMMYEDKDLSHIDAKAENTVHPRGYFENGNQTGLS